MQACCCAVPARPSTRHNYLNFRRRVRAPSYAFETVLLWEHVEGARRCARSRVGLPSAAAARVRLSVTRVQTARAVCDGMMGFRSTSRGSQHRQDSWHSEALLESGGSANDALVCCRERHTCREREKRNSAEQRSGEALTRPCLWFLGYTPIERVAGCRRLTRTPSFTASEGAHGRRRAMQRRLPLVSRANLRM